MGGVLIEVTGKLEVANRRKLIASRNAVAFVTSVTHTNIPLS